MDPKSKVKSDLKEAMKAKDTGRMSVLRMLQAEVQKREIEKRAPLDETEFVKLVSTMVKQRKESIDAFKKGGREDLAENESKEIEILKGYLPEPIGEEELAALVDAAIAESGASSPKEMGKVMQVVLPKVAGRADGKLVSQLVRTKLSS